MKKNLIPDQVVNGKCNFCMDMNTLESLTVPVVYVGFIGICLDCLNEIMYVFHEHIKTITKK